ncbi:MAG: hypothetical protein U0401_15660 [Anaerolineae bacterium]
MSKKAAHHGFAPGWHQDYPKIQILTIGELLARAEIKMPCKHGTFKSRPQKVESPQAGQSRMDI